MMKKINTINFIGYKPNRNKRNITKTIMELIGIALILGYVAAYFVILALVTGGD